MFGGGLDRADLAPYNPEEFDDSDDPNMMMGCHIGRFRGLNIANPQPGCIYAWADDSQSGIILARSNYYQVVSQEDPEMAAYHKLAGHDHQDLDSAHSGFPGLVLVRRSAKDERQIRDEEQSRRDELLRSGASEQAYLDGSTANELQSGGERFIGKEHRSFSTRGTSEDSEIISSWTPSRGISS